jgi:hypothetical protein
MSDKQEERALIYLGYEDRIMVDEGQKYFDTVLTEEERKLK